jgi:hypothetical protein
MVICVKCGKEQGRRSGSACDYKGNEQAGSEHAWMDRGEFIDELRDKLPPLIRERIAAWQKKYAEKQAAFSDRLMPYRKRRDEIQAAYAVYLNEGLPRDIKKKKQRALRSLLFDVIGCVIGFLIAFKVFFSLFSLDILDVLDTLELPPYIILTIIVVAVILLGKRVVKFLKTSRYAESQESSDELAREWRYNNGIGEVESKIEAEKDKWNNFRESLNRCVHSAERALVGSDEELLNYYNTDKQTKNWYLENMYEGEW